MNMNKNIIFGVAILLLIGSLLACENNPSPVNEGELITDIRLVFMPTTGGEAAEFRFEDLDGDGGNAPIIVGDTLRATVVYDVVAELLNRAVTPVVNVSAEIEAEGSEHQFFYQPQQNLPLAFTYSDIDDDGNPIGLIAQCAVGTTTVGTTGAFVFTLRHLLDKSAEGVATGDITYAGGETDVEIAFPVVVLP